MQPDFCRKKSGYARLEEKWSASVSSLVWEATTSTKHRLHSCSHSWTRGTGPIFFVVFLPCSLLCSFPPSPHTEQLEKGDPTSSKKRAIKNCLVWTLTCVDRAALWVEILWVEDFVTPGVNHKNYENSTLFVYCMFIDCKCECFEDSAKKSVYWRCLWDLETSKNWLIMCPLYDHTLYTGLPEGSRDPAGILSGAKRQDWSLDGCAGWSVVHIKKQNIYL